MSSIGVIFRSDVAVDSLPKGWVPPALGKRDEVLEVVRLCVPPSDPQLALNVTVEDGMEPRAISVSGVWGEKERAVLKAICTSLDARFYDAEACSFIDL